MLYWKSHIDQLLPKFSAASYFITVHHSRHISDGAYFHLIMNNGIIFYGNSPYRINIFRLQKKKSIRIFTSTRKRDSCRNLFKAPNSLNIFYRHYVLLSWIWINTRLIRIFMVRILGKVLIFFRLHTNCYFIKQVPTIWALRFSTVFLFI